MRSRSGAITLLAVALSCWGVTQPMAGEPSTVAPPDILFIAIDDLNDWVGHLGGNPDSRTPNLDRLAAQGVSFTNAHCVAPACNPSRAALMSVMRPSSTGIYWNGDDSEAALADILTLTEHFRNHGYVVAAGGKIFHQNSTDQRFWDEYQEREEITPTGMPAGGFTGLNRKYFDWGALDGVRDVDMPDYKLVSWAIEKLAKPPAGRPLFLALGIVKPHLPWYTPRHYFDLYPKEALTVPMAPNDDLDDVPPIGRQMASPAYDHLKVVEAGRWRDGIQAYLATIRFVDDQVGRILEALARAPRGNNTVVLLWSDNGWHLGEKQHWRKFTLWEESTRVPFIIVAPGVTNPGRLNSRAVDLLAVYPTLCELAGLPLPAHLQGMSVKQLLDNPEASWQGIALTTHGRGNHAVRSDRWRYIRYADGSEELYDHSVDPDEWQNLAGRPEYDYVKNEMGRWMPVDEVSHTPSSHRLNQDKTELGP